MPEKALMIIIRTKAKEIMHSLRTCYATNGPSTTGLAKLSLANFVDTDGLAGPSMAAMDDPARLSKTIGLDGPPKNCYRLTFCAVFTLNFHT